jgi:general secretion pathway protein K
MTIKRQAGVALITALLITAIATIAAVAMASRQQLDIRRAGNVIDVDLAYMFALGAEEWGKQVLRNDRKDNQTDNLEEDWATVLPPLSVEGGVVSGKIEDVQGLFNLNNLIDKGAPSAVDRQIFERLLQNLAVNIDIIDAVIDWMDKDDTQTFPDGAEDNAYLQQDIPYRTPNAPVASPSELALIKGMSYEDYSTVVPYVTALPERTTVNVNTAPAQVLMAVVDGLTESEAEQIMEDRVETPFNNTNDFMSHPLVKDKKVNQANIGVASKYFMINAATRFDQGQINLYSLVSRSDKAEVQTIMRAQGVY